jgi:MFS family permease
MKFKPKKFSSIRKYYLFQFFNSLVFFSPVIVLFLQANGLGMAQIMLLQSIYSIGVIILELPTGAFADYFGKKKSLMMGSLLWTVGLIGYGLSHSFWQFVIGELMVGIGSAFISGADRAYIHEILRETNEEKKYKKVEGTARGICQVSFSLGSLLGGFIGVVSPGLTLIATGASTFMGYLIEHTFPDVKKEPREEKTNYFVIIRKSIGLVGGNRRLLWLTLFFAAFNGLIWPMNFYSQPYLQMLGVPVYFFGFIFAGFNLIFALGSALTYWFEKMTKSWVFFAMSLTSVAAMLILGLFPSIHTFFLWSFFLTFYYMNQTIITDEVLKIIPSHQAATVMSFQSMTRRILYAFVGPILGVVTDNFGLQNTLVYYAFFILFFLSILIITEKRFK